MNLLLTKYFFQADWSEPHQFQLSIRNTKSNRRLKLEIWPLAIIYIRESTTMPILMDRVLRGPGAVGVTYFRVEELAHKFYYRKIHSN